MWGRRRLVLRGDSRVYTDRTPISRFMRLDNKEVRREKCVVSLNYLLFISDRSIGRVGPLVYI